MPVAIPSAHNMHIIAFILLIFGLAKIFLCLSVDKKDITSLVGELPSEYLDHIKLTLGIILLDGLLEVVSGLFILL